MNRQLHVAFLTLIGFFLTPGLFAQNPAGESFIKLKLSEEPSTDPASPTMLDLDIEGEGEIVIEGSSTPYSPDTDSYAVTSQEITIKGKVTSLDCGFSSQIASIDAIQANELKTVNIKYSSVKELLLAGNKSIESIAGSLSELSALDLSGCEKLKELNLSGIQTLKSISLSGCKALERAEMQNTSIESLDLNGLQSLAYLSLQRSNITTADFSKTPNLKELDLGYVSEITELDLSACTQLTELSASSCTALASVKFAPTETLKEVMLQTCSLTSIDLSNQTALEKVFLERNKLTSARFENCPKLRMLGVHLNYLTEEATNTLAEDLPDLTVGDDYEPGTFPGTLNATGIEVEYKEANKWSAKGITVATKKGWALQERNNNDYTSLPAFSFVKLEIEKQGEGTVEVKGFTSEDLNSLPEGFEYTLVATPAKGYKLTQIELDGEDITENPTFELIGNTKITVIFSDNTPSPDGYDYYLTKVTSSVKNPSLKTYSYGYDSQKRWISRTESDQNDNTLSFYEFSYDEKNRIKEIAMTLSVDYETDGKPSQYARFTYDEEGRIKTREMTLYDQILAKYEMFYRPDGKIDYWFDRNVDIMQEYIYDDAGRLIEERFGAATAQGDERPTINPSGKTFYSYDDAGNLTMEKTSAKTYNWLYIKGIRYEWDNNRKLSKLTAINYEYPEGEKDPEKGTEKEIHDLRFNYADEAESTVFWPQLPYTEGNGGILEFPYQIDGQATTAEYWGLTGDKPKHTFDIVYTFEASPVQAEKLALRGEISIRWISGLLSIEGEELTGVKVYDTEGKLVLDFVSDPCQRIDLSTDRLPKGIYIVKALTPAGSSTKKVANP